MASTKDRQRALERARYERRQKIEEQKRRDRQRQGRIVAASVVAVLVIGGGVTAAVALSGNSTKAAPAAASTGSAPAASAASAGATASATPEPVGYLPNGTAAKNVGTPTFDAATAAKPYTATITTNNGVVVFSALTTAAPYATYSFEYLAGKGYFNNTPCHRLTTANIFVLQCGDPTGSGSGGPGYKFQDENLTAFGAPGADGTVTYPAGTVAMANGGADTNGSQFFLVYKDSPLPPSYTPFGKITSGLDVLTAIAAKGSDNSNGTGDGKPTEATTIQTVATK
ncbi:MAG TPA: peptidylprolyl isomerase [Actinocrinis sp.]|nr:peptidylprolyl isomerase [Actinocrinis sp.]